MLGSYLIPLLLSKGHRVINLTTRKDLAGRGGNGVLNIFWNPSVGEVDRSQLGDVDAILNLAGFNLANRWTKENQQKMVQSRLDSTALLTDVALQLDNAPEVFVSASGSGYYADSDELMHEESAKGEGFIADLTEAWEEALLPLGQKNIRVVVMRTAVILDKQHGALAKMLPFFKLGLGAAVGSGQQYMSWIHAEDAAAAYVYAIENQNLQGIYNLTSDETITNKEFSSKLAKTLHRPFFLPGIPAFVLNLLFGKMAQLVLRSNRMSAQKLMRAGFKHKFPDLNSALNDVFRK